MVLKNNEDIKYQVYLEERKMLVDIEKDSSRLLDRAILTLASGAFGLSLALAKFISPNNNFLAINKLLISWIFFCLSILSTLVSFLTSQIACKRQREILEKVFLEDDNFDDEEIANSNIYAHFTKWLNGISILTFILGVIFLIFFTFVNIKGG